MCKLINTPFGAMCLTFIEDTNLIVGLNNFSEKYRKPF